MFGLFKKNTQKEFYKRMEECRSAHDYLAANNPFKSTPIKYQEKQKLIAKNKQWVSDNLPEIKTFLSNEELNQVREAFDFPLTLEWHKEG